MSTAAPPRPRAKPRMHPKIRQRVIAVKKEEGRKRLKVALALLLAAALGGGGWGVTRSALLDIDEVRTTGAQHTLLGDIIAAGGLEPGRPMVDVDLGRAAERIERLPWVHVAAVERLWPGSVVVRVAERSPVVGIADPEGGWVLVDGSGRVLSRQDGPPVGLPHVHDAQAVPSPGEALGGDLAAAARAAAALPSALRAVVGGVNLRPGGVELALTAGGVIKLGNPERDLTEKLRAAATVLKKVRPDEVGILDVTVPRAPVLARS